MKHLVTIVSAIVALTGGLYAQEITLQGVPVDGRLAKSVTKQLSVIPKTESNDFTFDDITFWVGEGENEAALVLQWNDDREPGAIVWGYRFDGNSNGYEMIKAIAAADNRLYFAASNSSYGYTIGGIGFDIDEDGDVALLDGDIRVEVVNGFAENGNFDNLKAADPDDLWFSGWMTGYWSYYAGENETIPPTDYSGFGASSRPLTDGSVDGWYFSDMSGSGEMAWKKIIPASTPTSAPQLPAEFTDGFFLQNEGWYGHDMGSINWVGNDGNIYYNVDDKSNDGTDILGVSSQFGTIYGGYYYAMSKQSTCLVIMDARTLKVVKSFNVIGGDETSGDGRAILGVSADKVYVGTNEGIFVLHTDGFTLDTTPIKGTEWNENTGSSHIGMMVRVGKYVFAAKKSTGVLVIDPETDTIEKTIENKNICGLTVSRDGTVWAVAKSQIIRISPVTLESATLDLPHAMVSPWSAWMPDKMCADPNENALYYAYGSGSWTNSETQICKLIINEDGTLTEDADFSFTLPMETSSQTIYGKIDIDPQSGCLLVTSPEAGYGTGAAQNRLYYVDCITGNIEKSIMLLNDNGEGYYWFPSMPVFPDNNAPEITLTDITLGKNETVAYNVTDIVSDADNMPALATVEAESGNESVFTVESNGFGFTVMPVSTGSADLHLTVNSNGRIISETVTVTVSETAGTAGIDATGSVAVYPTVATDVLNVTGLSQGNVAIYSTAGTQMIRHDLATGSTIDLGTLAPGVYIVKVTSADTVTTAKIMKQ